MVLSRALRGPRALRNARSLSTTPTPPKLAFAFDIDGVLKQGKHVLPQAKRVMRLLSGQDGRLSAPVPFLLMTNGGGVTDAKRRVLLSKDMGLELSPNQLVQSHTPLAPVMAAYADTPVLVVGGKGFAARDVAESYGLKRAYVAQDILHWNPSVWDKAKFDEADHDLVRRDIDFATTPLRAIFVLHDSYDWGRDMTIINELMQSDGGLLGTTRANRRKQPEGGEVPLWFSNPDLEWKSDYPVVRLGMGAFSTSCSAVYAAATGLPLPFTQYGKPHRPTYEFADKMLRRRADELRGPGAESLNVYMIGDNPLSDIWGANNYGWNSVLVRTGVYPGGEPSHKPTFIADDVELAVQWAIENELAKA
ncbi:putative CDP-alcohol phosphatidyltransferase class-I family protein [Vanrija pseudolonga]|uniref:Purtative CDP-alcohol phosphatidyltransferase class-I family protein n=1 Tax=Vanrija pseudolonga TaxID=143232 RepID=A0AAF0Y0Z9_9TREE|nr:purtative CDP-alcohol phosphatidyltransferase class-I family protein [Vanrija pseudolonga]